MNILVIILVLFTSIIYSQSHDTIIINTGSELHNISTIVEHKPSTSVFVMENLFVGHIPSPIRKLKHLERITIINNDLKEIPEYFKEYKKLNYLNLGSNKISNLKNLTYCKSLRTLILYRNMIDSVTNIGGLYLLKELDISSNRINTLPSELSNLEQLEELNLSDNPLNIEQIFTVISKLKYIKKLNLSSCNIEHLPESLGDLTHLKVLILSNNNIHSIDPFINNMNNLEYLYLSNNMIEKIPETLPSSLQAIIVAGNRINREEILKIKEVRPELIIIK